MLKVRVAKKDLFQLVLVLEIFGICLNINIENNYKKKNNKRVVYK